MKPKPDATAAAAPELEPAAAPEPDPNADTIRRQWADELWNRSLRHNGRP